MLLDEMIKNKELELPTLRENFKRISAMNLAEIFPPLTDFKGAISKPGRINLIAEIKKSSPSAGVIVEKFDHRELAKKYTEAGADALSVLTDYKYFNGSLLHLKAIKPLTKLPLLRKDFIIDEMQVIESRLSGADAVLLIARVLDDARLKQFLLKCKEIKLAALTECHNEAEVERALKFGADIIGINNRDLDTLKVDFNASLKLASKFPELKDIITVSESGISSNSQIKELKSAGFNAVLVGESLLKAQDLKLKVKELFG